MDILKYKDYEGTAELDMTRGVCRGKILFINDLVTYEAATPAKLQKEFEDAVDDYIETCAALGREPQKPLKGQFNVRIPPALHKAATLRALRDGASLNDVVVKALDEYVNSNAAVRHVENRTYYVIGPENTSTLAYAENLPAGQWVQAAGVATVAAAPLEHLVGERHVARSH